MAARRHCMCVRITPFLLRVHPSLYSFWPFAPEKSNGYLGYPPKGRRSTAQQPNRVGVPTRSPDPPSSHRQPHHCHSSPARRHIYATSSYTRTATLPPLLCTTETIRPPSSPNSPQPQELHTVPSSSHTPSVSLHRNSRASQLPSTGPRGRTSVHHRTNPSILRVECPPCQPDVALWLHGPCLCADPLLSDKIWVVAKRSK